MRILRTAVAAVCVLAASPAHAEDARDDLPASAAQDGEAAWQRVLREGERLFAEDADYPAAVELFERSYRLFPNARALNGIAVVYEMQGKYPEAVEILDRLVAEFGATLTDTGLAEVKERAAKLRARTGVVTLSAAQPGTRVLLDGREIGRAPLHRSVRTTPGPHRVVATLADHDPVALDVAVARGATVSVPITLVRTTVRWVRPMNAWIPWIALGAGALVTGAGGLVWQSGRNDLADAEETAHELWESDPHPIALEDLPSYDRAQSKRTAAIALVAGGGAALVTGVVLAIVNRAHPVREAPRSLRLVPSPGGVAVGLSF